MKALIFYFLPLLALLTGCTQNLFQAPAAPVPATAFALRPDYEYHIRKDDKISVSVWDHDELSVGSIYGIYNSNEVYGKWLLVDPVGRIDVPKVGAFAVEGLTISQAEEALRTTLAKWIVNPVVHLAVLNREITLLGEVNAPGKQLLDKERNSLVDVIGRGGDFGVYADKRRVQLIREEGGKTLVTSIDLTRFDQLAQHNLTVLPGDVVYVPSRGSKVFDRRAQSVIPITSAITTLIILAKLLL
jgi:polysaccharide biosynthesis/export protein